MEINLKPNTYLFGNAYRIVRFINSGGFGCTYEAEHILLNKRVAIKEFFVRDFCSRNPETGQVFVPIESKRSLVDRLKIKFLNEAKAISAMQHPNIVKLDAVFEENGTAYYVMSYIDGQTISEIVQREGPLAEQRMLKYTRQIADALQYVHSRNRLHLDVKPGNIMVDVNDNAFLIDFGLSKQYHDSSQSNSTTLMGWTMGFAPVEQMSHNVRIFSPCTDIYSFGATLYFMLSGIIPPDPISISDHGMKALPQSISTPVRAAIYRAMRLRKDQRPQSIAEFLSIIDDPNAMIPPFSQSRKKSQSAQKPIISQPPQKKSGNTLLVAILSMVAVFALVFAGCMYFFIMKKQDILLAKHDTTQQVAGQDADEEDADEDLEEAQETQTKSVAPARPKFSDDYIRNFTSPDLETFQLHGRVKLMIENRCRFYYDRNGTLVRYQAPSGRSYNIYHDNTNHLSSLQADGRVFTYGYEYGRLNYFRFYDDRGQEITHYFHEWNSEGWHTHATCYADRGETDVYFSYGNLDRYGNFRRMTINEYCDGYPDDPVVYTRTIKYYTE